MTQGNANDAELDKLLEKIARYGYYRDEDPWGLENGNKEDWIHPDEAKAAIESLLERRVIQELNSLRTKSWTMPRGRIVIDASEVAKRLAELSQREGKIT